MKTTTTALAVVVGAKGGEHAVEIRVLWDRGMLVEFQTKNGKRIPGFRVRAWRAW